MPAEVELSESFFDTKSQKYYDARLMSVPAVIDSLEFARSVQQISGQLPAASLHRLEDVLYDAAGCVDYRIRGDQDERGRPLLRLSITGQLHLQCQRCLGLLEYSIRASNTLLVATVGGLSDDELADPDAPDVVEASSELNVAEFVEDEVLLSLPLAPRHPEGACATRSDKQDNDSAGAESAFAKLAALKRRPDQSKE